MTIVLSLLAKLWPYIAGLLAFLGLIVGSYFRGKSVQAKRGTIEAQSDKAQRLSNLIDTIEKGAKENEVIKKIISQPDSSSRDNELSGLLSSDPTKTLAPDKSAD
jgi:hypothetical protein